MTLGYTSVPTEILQILFDTAVGSMDFGSGFLDDEEVTALRDIAQRLGQDPIVATPTGHHRKFYGHETNSGWLDTRTSTLYKSSYSCGASREYLKYLECTDCLSQ